MKPTYLSGLPRGINDFMCECVCVSVHTRTHACTRACTAHPRAGHILSSVVLHVCLLLVFLTANSCFPTGGVEWLPMGWGAEGPQCEGGVQRALPFVSLLTCRLMAIGPLGSRRLQNMGRRSHRVCGSVLPHWCGPRSHSLPLLLFASLPLAFPVVLLHATAPGQLSPRALILLIASAALECDSLPRPARTIHFLSFSQEAGEPLSHLSLVA